MLEFNLLPWREQRRARKRQQFLRTLVGLVGLAVLLLGGGAQVLRRHVSAQTFQNSALQQQLAALEPALVQLRSLRERRAALAPRSTLLQNLAAPRAQDVVLLDALARTQPQDLYYTALVREGTTLRLEGMASGTELTALLHALAASPVFGVPELRGIAAPRAEGAARGAFVVSVPLQGALEAAP
ncbi:MAG: PilN domain-containing protein [Pseudomonadales bacterium]|jgi:type IV pilus assembly protein PilN|nr:PilN domain-containing protein [Pseudomonadales bacterium]